MFYDNYVKLCNLAGKAPSAVAEDLGLSRASVNGWKHGKKPTDATLSKITNYFDVSADCLLGNEEQNEKPAATEGDGLDMYRAKLAELARNFTQEQWEKMIDHAELVKAAQQNQSKQ